MTLHSFPIRVYPADTDYGGIVHHAQYWRYCEQARVSWFEERYGPIEQMTEAHQLFFVVRRAQDDYFKPARLYDKLVIESVARLARPAVLTFQQRVLLASNQDVLFEGHLDLVCVDQSLKPKPVPWKG